MTSSSQTWIREKRFGSLHAGSVGFRGGCLNCMIRCIWCSVCACATVLSLWCLLTCSSSSRDRCVTYVRRSDAARLFHLAIARQKVHSNRWRPVTSHDVLTSTSATLWRHRSSEVLFIAVDGRSSRLHGEPFTVLLRINRLASSHPLTAHHSTSNLTLLNSSKIKLWRHNYFFYLVLVC